ncbi:MAG: SGNH/GDSL hydrolase family protein [Lachnospiraceae bacterium]|nr:SGNH/GDSL hydrolase family protein [Lachnospiraceae bacterium]
MRRKRAKEMITEIAKGLLIVGAFTAVALTGCGANQSTTVSDAVEEETSADANEEAVVMEEVTQDTAAPSMDTTYLTDEMYERATAFMEGDLTRLAKAMRKAEAGEEVTIGVIGGSITEGYTSSAYKNCYASHFQSWWQERFPEAKINFINAGVAGTSSYLGVHRVQEDLQLLH